MQQLGIFGNEPRALADDEQGRFVYVPSLLGPAEERATFEALRDGVEWRAWRRTMYDREVDVPRLVASFRIPDLPEALRRLLPRVEAMARVHFTAVGLNFYRDGRDSVAPHNDHTDEIRPGYPIALLSLGAVRRMTIRGKSKPRRVLDLDLEPGSLLVMSYETQTHYDHGVPKSREPVGPRISAAFRVRL
jgi:alkylated DNA repair dioxygenase AlkB